MLTMIYNIIYQSLFWFLILIGTLVIIYNWIIFIKRYILRKTNASWIPLVGGVSICIAFSLPTYKSLNDIAGIPLLLDYGCSWGFIHTLIFYIYLAVKGVFKMLIKKLR